MHVSNCFPKQPPWLDVFPFASDPKPKKLERATFPFNPIYYPHTPFYEVLVAFTGTGAWWWDTSGNWQVVEMRKRGVVCSGICTIENAVNHL
jgi:hypothetical protein